jgi:competence protein ComK
MNYEINNDTQLIMPVGKNSSKIIEVDDEYFIKEKTLNILEHSCEYFGSSLEGRKEGTKKLLGITHKSPIIVEESRKIIFFPTTSPEKDDCIWINLDKIEKYYKSGKKKSSIQFKSGDIINFDVSIGSLTNQILRATRLKYILEDRIAIKEDNNY